MRSRSWPDRAALVLGAAVEGVWCGALAAALTGASWPALALFAAVVILAARARGAPAGRGGQGAAPAAACRPAPRRRV